MLILIKAEFILKYEQQQQKIVQMKASNMLMLIHSARIMMMCKEAKATNPYFSNGKWKKNESKLIMNAHQTFMT